VYWTDLLQNRDTFLFY